MRLLNMQMAAVRFGVALTVLTAVMPDYAEGKHKLSSVTTFLHLFGVYAGAILCLGGMFSYCFYALWTWRLDLNSPADVFKNPAVWLPHGVTTVILVSPTPSPAASVAPGFHSSC